MVENSKGVFFPRDASKYLLKKIKGFIDRPFFGQAFKSSVPVGI